MRPTEINTAHDEGRLDLMLGDDPEYVALVERAAGVIGPVDIAALRQAGREDLVVLALDEDRIRFNDKESSMSIDTSNIKQRQRLNGFHQRKERSPHPTQAHARTQLPTPEDLPEASEDLRKALATWHDLIAAEREQAHEAAKANAAADAAGVTYKKKVGEALASGADPAKVKDETEKHKAIAQAHAGFSRDAAIQRDRLGVTLCALLDQEAETLFAPVEERIEDSANVMRGALTSVRDAWSGHTRDFEMRRWLSHIALDGGTVGAYHGASPIPRRGSGRTGNHRRPRQRTGQAQVR